ncbi:MAG: TolC family protein [Chloroflexia bacterium]|nr:TolC family protein [Chloroflexia bacterium]
MTKLKYILSAVFIITALTQTKGQKTMTLEDCRNQAIEANKDFKKASYQKKEAEAYQKAAKTAWLPSFSADLNYMQLFDIDDINMPGYFLPTADNEEAAQAGQFTGQSNVWSPGMQMELGNLSVLYGGLSVTQPIFTGGKIKYSNKQASVGVEMSELNYQLTYSQLIEKQTKPFGM